MAGYIRLPRDSQDDDLRIIGNTDNDSNHSRGSTDKRQNRRGVPIGLLLKFSALIVSIAASGVCFATLDNGGNHSGRHQAVPATMVAVGALVVNLNSIFGSHFQQRIGNIGLCEDCKQRILGRVNGKSLPTRLGHGIITIWAFVVGVIMAAMNIQGSAPEMRKCRASGAVLIVLSVLHLAMCIFGSPQTRIELRVVGNVISASSAAISIHSAERTFEDADGAPEAQALNPEGAVTETVESKA